MITKIKKPVLAKMTTYRSGIRWADIVSSSDTHSTHNHFVYTPEGLIEYTNDNDNTDNNIIIDSNENNNKIDNANNVNKKKKEKQDNNSNKVNKHTNNRSNNNENNNNNDAIYPRLNLEQSTSAYPQPLDFESSQYGLNLDFRINVNIDSSRSSSSPLVSDINEAQEKSASLSKFPKKAGFIGLLDSAKLSSSSSSLPSAVSSPSSSPTLSPSKHKHLSSAEKKKNNKQLSSSCVRNSSETYISLTPAKRKKKESFSSIPLSKSKKLQHGQERDKFNNMGYENDVGQNDQNDDENDAGTTFYPVNDNEDISVDKNKKDTAPSNDNDININEDNNNYYDRNRNNANNNEKKKTIENNNNNLNKVNNNENNYGSNYTAAVTSCSDNYSTDYNHNSVDRKSRTPPPKKRLCKNNNVSNNAPPAPSSVSSLLLSQQQLLLQQQCLHQQLLHHHQMINSNLNTISHITNNGNNSTITDYNINHFHNGNKKNINKNNHRDKMSITTSKSTNTSHNENHNKINNSNALNSCAGANNENSNSNKKNNKNSNNTNNSSSNNNNTTSDNDNKQHLFFSSLVSSPFMPFMPNNLSTSPSLSSSSAPLALSPSTSCTFNNTDLFLSPSFPLNSSKQSSSSANHENTAPSSFPHNIDIGTSSSTMFSPFSTSSSPSASPLSSLSSSPVYIGRISQKEELQKQFNGKLSHKNKNNNSNKNKNNNNSCIVSPFCTSPLISSSFLSPLNLMHHRNKNNNDDDDTTTIVDDDAEWFRREASRMKDIAIGKATEGYRNYIKVVSKNERRKSDPATPDPKKKMSKSKFSRMYTEWRRSLHCYDNNNYNNNTNHSNANTNNNRASVNENHFINGNNRENNNNNNNRPTSVDDDEIIFKFNQECQAKGLLAT